MKVIYRTKQRYIL